MGQVSTFEYLFERLAHDLESIKRDVEKMRKAKEMHFQAVICTC